MNERERAYKKIREAIAYGRLKPGEKLVEMDLCERFGVGRTPVREAIRQLQMEHYIEVIPNKGAIIKVRTIEELGWIYDTLAVLEAYAAGLLATKINKSQHSELRKIQDKLLRLVRDGQYSKYFDFNKAFHETIHNFAGNPILRDEITRLRNQTYRNTVVHMTLSEAVDTYLSDHEMILKAMLDKDPAGAEAAMRKHFNNTRSNLTKFARENPWFL